MFGIPGAATLPPMTGQAGLQPIAYQPQLALGRGLQPDFSGPLESQEKPSIGNAIAGNPVVRAVKAALTELGLYHGAVDDKLDAATRRSVLAFQKRNRLKATGKPDVQTRKALQRQVAARSATARAKSPGAQATTAPATPGAVLAPAVVPGAPTAGFAPTGLAQQPRLAPLTTTGLPGSATAPMHPGALPFGPDVTGAQPEQPTGPQLNATNQQGLTNAAQGATQAVTNNNTTETLGFSNSPYGYGYGDGVGMGHPGAYGAPYSGGLIGWNTTPGGLPMQPNANPYAAPGASMTGAWYLDDNPATQGGIKGFFSRLLG